MTSVILKEIYNSGASVVIFDIDGTLKDLCEEHRKSLNLTLISLNINKMSRFLIKTLNKIAMYMVKCGIFPTNKAKQDILLTVFSLIAIKNKKSFKDEYYKYYKEQIEIFEGVKNILSVLYKEKEVYFATINNQNYNLEHCGILSNQIVYTKGILKVTSYKKLLEKLNVKRSEVIIVGDNIFDDIISAKILGTKSILVNNYNSNFKSFMCKLLNHKYL